MRRKEGKPTGYYRTEEKGKVNRDNEEAKSTKKGKQVLILAVDNIIR